ncbi:MAG: hypothetical protein ACI8UO_004897 [Verrucomicrobiales bacterium]
MKRFIFLAAILSCSASIAGAQTAAQIGSLFPAGAQRGTSVEVELDGNYMPGPCKVWIGGEGLSAKEEVTEGQLTLDLAEDAQLGPRSISISSVQGASAPRLFVIGALPETIESEDFETTEVALPQTINGRLNPARDIDEFQVSLKAEQQLVCAVAAASLGSPNDTSLEIVNAEGKTVASANDNNGVDPFLVYKCEADGIYRVRIQNYNLSGGSNHIYRLTLTTGPYLDYAFPSGLQPERENHITLRGWNLTTGDSELVATTDSFVHLPQSANHLELPIVDHPAMLEHEPNNSAETANEIVAPHVIHGRFEKPGDLDVYTIRAKKGAKLNLKAVSSSSDVVFVISDNEGKIIREVDDSTPARGAPATRDPQFLFTFPADGAYHITLSERANRGGPRYVYQFHVAPPNPDVGLYIKVTEYAIIPGETLSIPIIVIRKGGLAEDIEIIAEDLPPGVTAEPIVHTAKSQPAAKLELSAAADAGFSGGVFRIVAKFKNEDQTITREADRTVDLWLSVSPKVPFELVVPTTIQEAPRLAAFPFPVTIKRDEGFAGEIQLVPVEPDVRGTVIPMDGSLVAGTEDKGTVPLIIQAQAIEGTTHRCRVMGVAEITGPDGVVHSVFHLPKTAMAMGCQPNLLTLTSTPEVVTREPGQGVEVTVTIERRVKLGEVTIALMAPGIEGVSATEVTIPAGQATANFKIDLAPNAELPPKLELELRASTTREGLPVGAVAPLILVD